MTNTKINAFASNLIARNKAQEFSNANQKKMDKLILHTSRELVANFMTSCEVAEDFATVKKVQRDNQHIDFYAVETLVAILRFCVEDIAVSKLTCNTYEIVKTALQLDKAKQEFTRYDAESALDIELKIADEKKPYIVRLDKHYSSAKRQASKVLTAMQSLNMIKEVSKDTFKINKSNAAVKAMRAQIVNA